MLPKKHLHKRRLRNLIPKILFLFFLFALTSAILFSWYFWQQTHKKLFVTPVGNIKTVHGNMVPSSPDSSSIDSLLKKNDLSAISVTTASDSAIFVTLDTGEQIIFSQSKDLNQQIASLQLIRRQLTIEGKRLGRVDFRFDNPIITY